MQKYIKNQQQGFFQKVDVKKTGLFQIKTCKMHITQK